MKHRLLFAAFMVVAAITSNAFAQTNYDFSAAATSGQTLYFRISESNAVVVNPTGGNDSTAWNGYTKPSGALTLPATVTYNNTTYSVVAIDNFAFYSCGGITTLNITNVQVIGQSAFACCEGLSSINFGSVRQIAPFAFQNCDGLTSVSFPSTFLMTGVGVFAECDNLVSITVAAGNPAFDCRDNCNAIINSSTNIMLYGCKTSTFPSTVKGVWMYAFMGLPITSVVMPASMEFVDDYAFYGCNQLSTLVIGDSIRTIGRFAFGYCSHLTGTLVIPDTVKNLGQAAFAYCTGLSALSLGKNVDTISEYAFAYDANIASIESKAVLPPTIDGSYVFYSVPGSAPVTVPCGSQAAYSAASGWSNFSNIQCASGASIVCDTTISLVCATGQTLNYYLNCDTTATLTGYTGTCTGPLTIPDTVMYNGMAYPVTAIGDSAFYLCSGLTGTLTIPNSVMHIGNYSFRGCHGLTGTLNIPNSVNSIGNSAFQMCYGFTGSLSIPNSVTSIGDYAFESCTGFTGSLTISSSMASIGACAFQGCTSFTGSLTIPNSVTSIGMRAFYYCSGFTGSLSIPNSVTFIGEFAFYNCSGFNGTLTISESVTSIDGYVFFACSGFTGSLTIPNHVTSIGDNAFSGCSGFTGSLSIPNSVTSIGDYAFAYCSGFTGTLIIPNSVTTIGVYAFQNCSGFTGTLIIPNTVTSIRIRTFWGCNGFSSVTIPNSVTTIGERAFADCSGLSSVTSLATAPPTLVVNAAFNGVPDTIPVYIPCGSLSAYQADAGWSYFSNIQGQYDSYSTETVTACDTFAWHGNIYTASRTVQDTLTNAAGCDSIVTLNLTVNYRTDTAYTQIACDSFTWSTTSYDVTTTPTGAINGQFRVGENSRVFISQGNLQYQASTGTWRFATNQYDTIGSANSNISSAYSGWIDLFCWGTSGWDNGNVYYQPYNSADYSSSNNGADYGPSGSYNLTGSYANADWGVNNAVSNGGNAAGLWRTLTRDEWTYLFNSRTGCSTIGGTSNGRYALAQVNGVGGMILFPDSYTHPSGVAAPQNVNSTSVTWGNNSYSTSDWTAMQTAGAVFLPAAGWRTGTSVSNVGSHGFYWSSSVCNDYGACYVYFYSGYLLPEFANNRANGFSVRLVRGYNSIETSDTYNTSGTYYHSYTAANGCASVDTLHLTIHSSTAYTDVQTACDSLTWIDGATYTASTATATDTLVSAAGCDSVVTLNLTINNSTTGSETVTACNMYVWHNRTLTASTDTVTYRTTNAAGCDSTVTLNLTINQCNTTDITACDTFTWNGTLYTQSGTYIHGNDTLHLTINNTATGVDNVVACDDFVWINGLLYTESTNNDFQYTYPRAAANGCDSVVNLNLTIKYSVTTTETVTACNIYTWHSRTFTSSTDTATYRINNVAPNGCDSVFTLHLTINHDSITSATITAVNSYAWHDNTYTTSGTYIHRYITVHGCNGADTLHLTITDAQSTFTVRAASANSTMGSASVVGNSTVQQGAQGTVQAIANSGYRFVRWSDGSTANPYTFTVTQDTLLTAYFEGNSYTVTVVNGNPGRGMVSGSGTATYGSRRNISAAPNYGYTFSNWSDGDSNAHRTITVTGDITLTAYFGVRQFHIGVAPANYAQGTVTGSGDYDYMSTVTIEATPANGYEFAQWSDGDTLNPRRITVMRDSAFTATFREVPVIPTYTVTATSANTAMGSVTGGGSYEEGTVATLTARANDGYEFVQWNDGVTANPRSVTVLSDTAFTATFREVYVQHSYTVSVLSNDGSIGRVTGGGIYSEGAAVHIAAYPLSHCRFVRWSDGVTEQYRTFTAERDISLIAFFARDSVNITARANDDRMGSVTGGGSYAYGSSATLTATPLSGYRFVRWSTGERTSSITVTVRNATSYTAFFDRATQGVDEAEGAAVCVWSHGLTIHVAGLTGEPLKVYDLTGRLVAERTAAHGDMVIPVTHPGLYLVQTGTATHKVLTR